MRQGWRRLEVNDLGANDLEANDLGAPSWSQQPKPRPLTKNCSTGLTLPYIFSAVLKKMFISSLGSIINSRDPSIALGLWEDGLSVDATRPFNKTELFPESLEVIGYAWNSVWHWGSGSRPYNLANAGFKVWTVQMIGLAALLSWNAWIDQW